MLEGLEERFPHVSLLQWREAYHYCQPRVWVVNGDLLIEPDRITMIIAWVTMIHGPAIDAPDVYVPASIYLARKVNTVIWEINKVLATYQGKTTPQAANAYLSLLRKLRLEDVIADHIQQFPGSFAVPRSNRGL